MKDNTFIKLAIIISVLAILAFLQGKEYGSFQSARGCDIPEPENTGLLL